jgi:hypothetical protein
MPGAQALAAPVVLAASHARGRGGAAAAPPGPAAGPRPLLLLVPRHPQRFDEVAERWPRRPPAVALRRSAGPRPPPTARRCLADVGWTRRLHRRDAAVLRGWPTWPLLGGSFAPLGGQNLIEAAACGCPLLMGPHTFNFAAAAEVLAQDVAPHGAQVGGRAQVAALRSGPSRARPGQSLTPGRRARRRQHEGRTAAAVVGALRAVDATSRPNSVATSTTLRCPVPPACRPWCKRGQRGVQRAQVVGRGALGAAWLACESQPPISSTATWLPRCRNSPPCAPGPPRPGGPRRCRWPSGHAGLGAQAARAGQRLRQRRVVAVEHLEPRHQVGAGFGQCRRGPGVDLAGPRSTSGTAVSSATALIGARRHPGGQRAAQPAGGQLVRAAAAAFQHLLGVEVRCARGRAGPPRAARPARRGRTAHASAAAADAAQTGLQRQRERPANWPSAAARLGKGRVAHGGHRGQAVHAAAQMTKTKRGAGGGRPHLGQAQPGPGRQGLAASAAQEFGVGCSSWAPVSGAGIRAPAAAGPTPAGRRPRVRSAAPCRPAAWAQAGLRPAPGRRPGGPRSATRVAHSTRFHTASGPSHSSARSGQPAGEGAACTRWPSWPMPASGWRANAGRPAAAGARC